MNALINYRAVGAACGIGFLAYCVYFDRQRRSAPDYQAKVKARRERERQAREVEDDIELPQAGDKEATEKFFIKQIEIGEELIQAGDVDKAVIHIAHAIVLCPQPQQLLSYMREVLPTDAYNKLVANLSVVNKKITETYKKISIVQEEDVE